MNVRIIISDMPGVKIAEDHKDLGEVVAMSPEDLKAWLDGLVDLCRTRGAVKAKAR